MNHALYVALLSLALCLGMLLMIEAGRRVAIARLARDPNGAKTGFSTIEAAVLALLSLLLAFTVNGASSRFDMRRNLVIQETAAMNSAYIRLDVLPSHLQPAIKENFRRYVDTRIEVYRKVPDIDTASAEIAKAAHLQKAIWRQAVDGVQAEDAPAQLFVLALASALLSGYGMAADSSRSWLHILCLSVIISVTVYVIMDLEFPRLGLIRMDDFDNALVEARKAINEVGLDQNVHPSDVVTPKSFFGATIGGWLSKLS